MYASVPKIERRLHELANLRYIDTRPIGPVEIVELNQAEEGTARQTLQVGERWGKRDGLFSINFEVEIPPSWREGTVALRLDFSTPAGGWTINTAEGLLYVNGQALHALDRYHREIILPPDLAARERLEIAIRMWAGINEDFHTAHTFELRLLDDTTDRLYHLMYLALDGIKSLSEDSSTYVAVLESLEKACLKLDFSRPRSAEFYASCQAACQSMAASLQALVIERGEWQPRAIATGHAHIDVAWLWRLRHTRLKAANTFSTALYHMDRYPHFIFTQSQPQLYEYVKEDHPEIYARIKQKIAAGQWEPEGAMWVEADTNLTGGESLVRQFLFGQRFFRQEFGYNCKVLWLPDVFGYSAALPQLIKGAGAEYFITTKISWNEVNRVPVDTFWWQGLDGTNVLAYFITAQNEEGEPYYTYNGDMRPGMLARAWKNYRHKESNRELLVAYGWGDGGGGPTRQMIEAAHTLRHPLTQNIPAVSTGRIADFMDRLNQTVRADQNLPHWVGELYLEFHRGTYTSQAHTKQGNRRSEQLLHDAELYSTLAQNLTGQPYPQQALNAAWKTVLTDQFHDILPGSSIGPVYLDTAEHYAAVAATTGQIIEHSCQKLVEKIATPADSLVVFNSLGWEREGLLELDAATARTLALPQQELEEGRALVQVSGVAALGYHSFAPAPAQPSPAPAGISASRQHLENDFYRLELNEHGQITRLLDKQAIAFDGAFDGNGSGREVIAAGQRANVFQLFEDKPVEYDAWNIDAYFEQKKVELSHPVRVEVVEQGPLRAGLRLEWHYLGRTTLSQVIYLYAHSRRIDFVTEVDWQERQTLLKVTFPVEVHSGRATAEIQWGNLERPTHRNTSWDRARFETCAHKWFDLSEGDYGVALLNDCKYGYDVVNNILRLTLLRGPISPDPQADLGRHRFTYSLFPHQGGWYEGGVHRAAYELNFPLRPVLKSPLNGSGPGSATLPATFGLVEVSPANVIIETVKKAEDSDDLVIRLYECANRRVRLQLRLPFAVSQVAETNLLEENGQAVELAPDRQTILSTINPYQIKTFVVKR